MKQKILILCVLGLVVQNSLAMGQSPKVSPNLSNSCDVVLAQFNHQVLHDRVNTQELVSIIRSLNKTNQLPDRYVSKRQARSLGWTPGTYFDKIDALQGKAIGGDYFGNYEKRLPTDQWREADLDYHGKKRNAKRLIYSQTKDLRFVTIDHYTSFKKVPECQ